MATNAFANEVSTEVAASAKDWQIESHALDTMLSTVSPMTGPVTQLTGSEILQPISLPRFDQCAHCFSSCQPLAEASGESGWADKPL